MSEYSLGLFARCEHCQRETRVKDQLAGRTLRCRECGGEFVVSSAASPGMQYEPLRPHQSPSGPPYGGPIGQTQEPNSIAVVGFVLSLLGICSAAVLSPIALGCSVAGLRREHNKGYAVAGTIISSIQLIMLVLGILQFLIIGRFFWQAGEEISEIVDDVRDQAQQQMDAAKTAAAISQAAEMIDNQALAVGELPAEEEGNRLIRFQKDAWNSVLKYELEDGRLSGYSISSPGPDQAWETVDDTGRTLASPVITSAAEAIVLIDEKDPRRQQLGLSWLQTSRPSEIDRHRVVQAVTPLAQDPELKLAAARVLALWAEPDEIQEMAEANEVEGDAVVAAIAEDRQPAKPQNLLPFINDSDSSTRRKAREAVAESSLTSDAVVDQCLADLTDRAREFAAMEYLSELPLTEESRPKVKSALFAILSEGDAAGIRTRNVMRILNRAGLTEADIPELTRIYPKCNHDPVFDVLIQHLNEDMISYLLSTLDGPGATASRAATFFERMGPAGESHLWPILRSGSSAGQSNALAVLAKIGTTKSVPHLEALRASGSSEREAQRTIDAIRAANRQPSVPLTPEAEESG